MNGYMLEVDGAFECAYLMLEDLLLDNPNLSQIAVEAITRLEIGQSFTDGGDSVPTWTIRRVSE